MSILIKGMEMPKKIEPELVIEFADGIDGTRYARLYHYQYGSLTDWFEAVSVPPHGRLIDADAYESLLRGIGNREYRRENGTICDAIKFLHPYYAPTIIPTELVKKDIYE